MLNPETINRVNKKVMEALDFIEARGSRRQWLRANPIAAIVFRSVNELADLERGVKINSQVAHHPKESLERNTIKGFGGVLKIAAEVLKK